MIAYIVDMSLYVTCSDVISGSHVVQSAYGFETSSGVTRRGWGGRTAPGDTLQGRDTRRKKICKQIYKE